MPAPETDRSGAPDAETGQTKAFEPPAFSTFGNGYNCVCGVWVGWTELPHACISAATFTSNGKKYAYKRIGNHSK